MAPKIIAAVIALAALAPACSEDPVVCGHDVSDLHSSVVALDPATGATRWNTEIPLAVDPLPPPEDGEIRVSLAGRGKDARLEAETGRFLGTTSATHDRAVGAGGVFVDGKPVGEPVEIMGMRVARQSEPGSYFVEATQGSEPRWRFDTDRRSLSPPALVEGQLVVVTHDPRPFCP